MGYIFNPVDTWTDLGLNEGCGWLHWKPISVYGRFHLPGGLILFADLILRRCTPLILLLSNIGCGLLTHAVLLEMDDLLVA